MTATRLYRIDPYRAESDGTVLAVLEFDGRPAARLDATIFYPTSGGQPNDLGTLNGVNVIDVVEVSGDILHVTERPLAVGPVHGAIDWARRFDHMQQHTGQHILSQAFERVAGAETVSFHMGSGACTIDLSISTLDRATVARVEDVANAVVLADTPVVVREYEPEALETVALRRPPAVEGRVRVIHIGDYDTCACGGTHVRAAGEAGPIHVARWERRRDQVRVEFLCGWRALRDYRLQSEITSDLATRFSVAVPEVGEAVTRLADQEAATRRRSEELERRVLGYELERLRAEETSVGPWRVVRAVLDDADPAAMRYLAQHLSEGAGTVALLAVREPAQLCFARAQDVDLDVVRLLRESAGAFGGRGGGQPHMAQGGGVDPAHVTDVLIRAEERLRANG